MEYQQSQIDKAVRMKRPPCDSAGRTYTPSIPGRLRKLPRPALQLGSPGVIHVHRGNVIRGTLLSHRGLRHHDAEVRAAIEVDLHLLPFSSPPLFTNLTSTGCGVAGIVPSLLWFCG